jgi:hypothetical protein
MKLLAYNIVQGKKMDSPLQKWLKRMLEVRDTTGCVMRECGLEPLLFNWFLAAMRAACGCTIL